MLLLILFPVYIKEDGASAVTGTANSSSTSLTLTSGKNTASVAITPTNASGAFAASSSTNKAEFNVSTNNYTGYTLAITASDDTGNLVNTTTSDTIASITTNLTESSFNTSANNNKWGFKPSRYVSNNTVITNTGDGSVFLPSPTTTPTLLDHTNVANSTANNYTIALGIRADHNTYAGTYTKTFTLVATANPTTYTINYNKNTTDSVSNMPAASTTGSTTSTSITLPNTVPTRAHYSFSGWCSTTTTTTTTNGVDSCSGTVYNPNGNGTNLTYGLDQTTANTTTLYAMWKIDTFTLTLTSGSNITNITASPNNANGVYNYGQTVTLTAYKTTDTTCKSYATPTWSTTAGTLSATSGNSITITMPASNVTVTATSAESNVPQTITLSRSGGASGINIGGTNYTGSSVSLACGTYNISGNYSSGYEFSSWAISGSASLSSTSSASTTMTVSGPGTLTLNGKSSKLYLQNVTSATCPTTATTAYDSRDEEAYTIQRLADGNCWLLDNLRLDLTNATVKNNLTASTTNASATTLNYLKNGGGTTSDKYAITGVVEWTSSPNYASLFSYSDPLIATSGSGNNGSWTKDTLQSYGSGSGKIGVYYNFCAASAGSYCYGDGTSPGSPSGDATEDICPKGWRMPMGYYYGEYQSLYTAYRSKVTNFKNALRTPLSGYFNSGSADDQGFYGYFWSSTYGNSNVMYDLLVRSSSVDPQHNSVRYRGFSVRCVLQ